MPEIQAPSFDFKELSAEPAVASAAENQTKQNEIKKKLDDNDDELKEQKKLKEEETGEPELILFKEKCEQALRPIFEKVLHNYIKDYKAELITKIDNFNGCDYFEIGIEWDFVKDDYLAEKRPQKSIGLIVFRDVYESYKNNSKFKSKFESRGWKTWSLTSAAEKKKSYVYLIKEASQMQRIDAFRSCWDMEHSTVIGSPDWEEKVWAEIKRQLRHPDKN
jgi:hypothetical protein